MYLKTVINLFKLQIQITKEFFKMTFTKNSSIARSYVILILASNGEMTIENVPNVGNLRETVESILLSEDAA